MDRLPRSFSDSGSTRTKKTKGNGRTPLKTTVGKLLVHRSNLAHLCLQIKISWDRARLICDVLSMAESMRQRHG